MRFQAFVPREASGLISQNILKDVLVQAQARDQPLELAVLLLEQLPEPQFAKAKTAITLLQAIERLFRIPIRRITSATGVPVSACFIANAICSSVYLEFVMSQLLARRLLKTENSRSKWMKKQGGRHLRA